MTKDQKIKRSQPSAAPTWNARQLPQAAIFFAHYIYRANSQPRFAARFDRAYSSIMCSTWIED
jgi:hypothetical protein